MVPRVNRTPEELRAASDHLFYEVEMLDSTARRLLEGGLDQTCTNALLESFTVHTHALLQFFFRPSYWARLAAKFKLNIKYLRQVTVTQ